MDEFEKKMQELASKRAELTARLVESEQKLQDIDAKMDDLARRQKARMKADIRVDDKMLENLKATSEAQKKIISGDHKKPTVISTDKNPAPNKTGDAAKTGEKQRSQMITRELTLEDITVRPKEAREMTDDTP